MRCNGGGRIQCGGEYEDNTLSESPIRAVTGHLRALCNQTRAASCVSSNNNNNIQKEEDLMLLQILDKIITSQTNTC